MLFRSFANRLDDKFAGGATIEEAAGDLSLTITRIAAVDRNGRDSAGNVVGGLPAGDEFLSAAFATATGQTSLLGEASDGSEFVLRVDGVTEPALRPLNEVRNAVREALMTESRETASAARADEAVTRSEGGESFDAVIDELGLTTDRGAAVRRDGDGRGPGLAPAFVAARVAMCSAAARGPSLRS